MTTGSYWAVAQTVTKMEHAVRREIEKANHGAFVPTFAKRWKVDGKTYVKEFPLIGGYVFFYTQGEDWAGIPDVHGVYDVLATPKHLGESKRTASRVSEKEMARLFFGHAKGLHNRTDPPRFTKYYRPPPTSKRNSRKPRPGNRLRNISVA